MKLVMIAGPNDPEIVDTDTEDGKRIAAEALLDVGWEDIAFWGRTEDGDLEPLDRTRVEQVSSDERYRYLRATWTWWPDPRKNAVHFAFDWDERR